jgi:hypothetical protein
MVKTFFRKGARERRTDDFRKRENAETDASIMAGVFARLKISDPTAVATIPISRDASSHCACDFQ